MPVLPVGHDRLQEQIQGDHLPDLQRHRSQAEI
jgi:hypothetical protein